METGSVRVHSRVKWFCSRHKAAHFHSFSCCHISNRSSEICNHTCFFASNTLLLKPETHLQKFLKHAWLDRRFDAVYRRNKQLRDEMWQIRFTSLFDVLQLTPPPLILCVCVHALYECMTSFPAVVCVCVRSENKGIGKEVSWLLLAGFPTFREKKPH